MTEKIRRHKCFAPIVVFIVLTVIFAILSALFDRPTTDEPPTPTRDIMATYDAFRDKMATAEWEFEFGRVTPTPTPRPWPTSTLTPNEIRWATAHARPAPPPIDEFCRLFDEAILYEFPPPVRMTDEEWDAWLDTQHVLNHDGSGWLVRQKMREALSELADDPRYDLTRADVETILEVVDNERVRLDQTLGQIGDVIEECRDALDDDSFMIDVRPDLSDTLVVE